MYISTTILDSIYTPWPIKTCHFVLDYNSDFLSHSFAFYSSGNRNEHYTVPGREVIFKERPTLFFLCPLLRPSDVSWDGLYILPLSFIFNYQTNPGQTRAATTREKYIRGSVLGWTWLIHSDVLPTPPLNFTGVKKCEILARFSTPVAFDAL